MTPAQWELRVRVNDIVRVRKLITRTEYGQWRWADGPKAGKLLNRTLDGRTTRIDGRIYDYTQFDYYLAQYDREIAKKEGTNGTTQA